MKHLISSRYLFEKFSEGTKRLNKVVTLFFLMACSFSAYTQLTLVKDINTISATTDPSYQGLNSSYPGGFINMAGYTYFSAKGPEGAELWKTNATQGGTVLVKDIRTGPASSVPTAFIEMNGVVFFIANDGIYGNELWKSDGTAEGTVLVKDINPGSADGVNYCSYCGGKAFIVMNNKLYFQANNGINGQELWETDGTEAGTKQVKDINPGTNGSYPVWFASLNGKLFFSAQTSSTGGELWATDGTSAGTYLVKDLATGPGHANISNIVPLGNLILFSASGTTGDIELYKSDGTETGTQLVKNISASSSSYPQTFMAYNGAVYFYCNDGVAGTELWKSDGTEMGTVMVKDIVLGSGGLSPSGSFAIKGDLFFTIYTPTYGQELWKTDGTDAGTALVKDINPGTTGANISYLTNVNGTLYFTAEAPSTGYELWKSDGTDSGTELIKDIYPGSQYYGPNSSSPSGFIPSNGTILFSATDAITGNELWKTDGTSGGTVMVKDIFNPTKNGFQGHHVRVGNLVMFSADDGVNGNELWKTDGTDAGTVLVKDLSPGSMSSYFNSFTNVNGMLFFQANGGLWRSDGTTAGTISLKSGNIGSEMASTGNTLFFDYYDNVNGSELWKSDGTVIGTVRVKDINPTGMYSPAGNFVNVNGTLFFSANDGVNGTELWKTDGTELGTEIVKIIVPGTGDDYSFRLFASGSTLFFWVNDGTNGQELWKSDGTTAGTVLVKDINPGTGGSFYAYAATTLNGKFYFTANSPAYGAELWETDGTTAGTVLVKDVVPGGTGSTPTNFINLGSFFVFTWIDESSTKPNLWKSDGTTNGTVSVTNFPSINFASSMQQSKQGASIGYFVMNQGYSWQIWRTDGTAAGTFAITPFVSSTLPLSFVGPDEILVSFDGNGLTGTELWKYTPETLNPELKVMQSYLEPANASEYDFGPVESGASSLPVAYAIVNTGNATLVIDDISVSGTNAGDFVLNKTTTVNKVNPGSSTTFTIKFSPAALGNRIATLQILSNDVDESPYTIAVKGEGTPLSQTISFSPLTGATYGDPVFNLFATASSGLPVTFSSSDLNVATISGNALTIVGAGTADITASQNGNATYLAATPVVRTLSVGKASLTAKADNAGKVYGEVNPTFTIAYSGFIGDDDAEDIDTPPSASTLATASTAVGQYDINVTGGTDNNYDITPDVTPGVLTIGKAALVAKADNKTRAYGATNPNFTIGYTGFVNGDDALDIDEEGTASTVATAFSETGLYNIDITEGTDNNYTIETSATPGELTITKAVLITRADDKSRTYGEANPSFTFGYTGFVNGDDETDIDEPPSASTTATSTSDAGQVNIDVTGGVDNNYTFEEDIEKGKLTIDKAILTAKTDDKSRVYGVGNPAFSVSYSGFVNGDDASDIDTAPSASTTATILSDAGQYGIGLSAGTDNNYDIVPAGTQGILTIGKATLTVKADDKSRVYGTNNPTFSFTFSGFVNGDDALDIDTPPSASTTTTTLSDVGQYDIVLAGGTDNNYDMVPAGTQGILTISKATLTVKADDKSRNFGEANPAFTLGYVGFVNGDDALDIDTPPTASTTAVSSSVPGAYDIDIAGGTDNNYELVSDASKGRLTINKSPQSVTFDSIVDKLLSDPPFLVNAASSSGLSVLLTASSDKVTINGNQITLVKPGRVAIRANQPGNVSYLAAAPVENSFCINPLPPVITVDISNPAAPILTSSSTSGNQWFLNGIAIEAATGTTHVVNVKGSYQVKATIDDCVSGLSEAKVFVVTGDTDPAKSNSLATVYPNPAENRLSLRLSGFDPNARVHINFIDAQGRTIENLTEMGEKEILVEVGHYAAGIYVVRMVQENETQQIRFVKK